MSPARGEPAGGAVVVLAGGQLAAPEILRPRLRALRPARVIAADGGARHAEPLGLDVDLVVGDMDSLPAEARRRLEARDVGFLTWPAAKDETDLELALGLALEGSPERVAVLAALGSRLDMSLANVLLLADPRFAGRRTELWDGAQTAWLLRPPGGGLAETPAEGDRISLLPLRGDAEGLRTRGLRWPLRDEPLRFGAARGVSNEATGEEVEIRLRAGLLLLVHTPRGAIEEGWHE